MDLKTTFLDPAVRRVARFAVHAISRTRLPKIKGTVHLSGISGPVEILRDRWSVAHIYAATAADAVFAQGYTHAQERLWQIDFNRRVVAGRLSEILGKAALPADRVMRTMGFRRIVEEEAALLPETVRSLLQAYCAGVNAWIESARTAHKLPVEFSLLGYEPEPYLPADVLGWAKLMSWTLAANWETEFLRGQVVARIGAEKAAGLELDSGQAWAAILDAAGLSGSLSGLDPTGPYTGGKAGDGVGSNNWVIHGSRTPSGKPLLANDMHLDLTAPAIWFENHLSSPELDVTGLSLPGAPLVISVHNRHLAWGFTDGFADVQDLYEEHLRTASDGSIEYEYMGEWLPAEVRREEIKVKGESPVWHEVVATRHGPIINLLFQEAYPSAPPMALRWTALDHETTFHAIYRVNIARSCAEFRQALRDFSGPAQNVVYADTQGNIEFTMNGRVPVRARGDGSVPVPGWTGEYEWIGEVPFEALPHLENPASGFIATANNFHSRAPGQHFIGRDFCQNDRATRIGELIQARPQIDIAYIQAMHYDQVSVSARIVAGFLGNLPVGDPDLREIIDEMKAWDGRLAPESALAAIYQVTVRQALGLVLTHHLGDLGVHVQGQGPASGLWNQRAWEWLVRLLQTPASPWFDLGGGEQRDDVLAKALRLAVDFLKQELGAEWRAWTWGRLHQLTFHHILGSQPLLATAFNVGPIPVGGDGTTVCASFSNLHNLDSASVIGPAFRFIADLSDLDHCWGVLAPGQSGHPGSPAYGDSVRPWLSGQYHPMLFRRDEIDQYLAARLELVPK